MKTALVLFILLIALTCRAQDALLIEFSEPMDTLGLRIVDNYQLRFKPNASEIILSTNPYPVRIDSIGFTQWDNVVILFTSEHPDTAGVFQVRVFNVFDLAGNEINLEKNIGYY